MRALVLLLLVGCGGSVEALEGGPPDAPGDTQTAPPDSGAPDSPPEAQSPDTGVQCAHPLCCLDAERYRCANSPAWHYCAVQPEGICQGNTCTGTRCP